MAWLVSLILVDFDWYLGFGRGWMKRWKTFVLPVLLPLCNHDHQQDATEQSPRVPRTTPMVMALAVSSEMPPPEMPSAAPKD